jgi:glutamine amidotransferase
MDNLREYGLVDVVRRVVERGTPFLGICLGLQLLFEESEEFGPVPGSACCAGAACASAIGRSGFRVPTWAGTRSASARRRRRSPGSRTGCPSTSCTPTTSSRATRLIATLTDYGGEFVSAIARDNLFACQFHPRRASASACRFCATSVAGRRARTEAVATAGA